GVTRDLLRIEPVEGAAVALAFIEHRRPAESRLRGFENEKLEMCAVIVGRHTPFPIVILAQQLMIDVDPGTPFGLHIRLAQKAADSESEDRNAAACLVKESGY